VVEVGNGIEYQEENQSKENCLPIAFRFLGVASNIRDGDPAFTKRKTRRLFVNAKKMVYSRDVRVKMRESSKT
jgi:hypothetical protein